MMQIYLFYCAIFAWLLKVDGADKHTIRMNSHRHRNLVLQNRAASTSLHEIVLAVRQKNLDIIESELLDRSTPGHLNYQKWLSFSQVGILTSNTFGAAKIKDWLTKNNASITWVSAHSDYIKATAKVEVWEYLFSTVFHEWIEISDQMDSHESRERYLKSSPYVLAKEYTIPASMRVHLSAAFNTVQPPPLLSIRRHLKWKDNSIKDSFHSDNVNLQGILRLFFMHLILPNSIDVIILS